MEVDGEAGSIVAPMTKPGKDADGVAQTEADHFGLSGVRRTRRHARPSPDAAQVHDAEIEIAEQSLLPLFTCWNCCRNLSSVEL
jgi:hypothetical protein